MNALLLLPSSSPAYDILSQAIYLKKKGHTPFFLSTTPKGEMHRLCEKHEIKSNSLNIYSLNIKNYLFASFKLFQVIKKEKIDLVLSNNLQGNFVAVLSRFIHGKRTILTRHHTDYIFTGNNKNAKRQQRFVNRYGKEFIAISDRVRIQMIKEGISPDKIYRMNLGFDFGLFPKADNNLVAQLKNDKLNSFKICTVARLIPLKRHKLLFEAILALDNRGMDIKLWVVGDGILSSKLKEMAHYSKLDHAIEFTGYINNPENYLAASDLLVHVSESEASSHVIREAGLVETPVLVCNEVGDFEDYITDNKNGFFIDKHVTASKLADKIINLSWKTELRNKTAMELKKTVLDQFSFIKNGDALLKIIENE